MNKRPSHSTPACPVIENLESRALFSAVFPSMEFGSALHQSGVVAAAKAATKLTTKTTLAVSAGTLGQPITFTVTVRAAAVAGSPTGTVNIIDHGNVLQTLTLSPTTSSDAGSASSTATFTLTQPLGGSAYFIGKHPVSATFVPTGTFVKSSGKAVFTVSKAAYTALAGGVMVATITGGTGPQIQTGQTASVLYTGYLAKTGAIFDDSAKHGGAHFSFKIDGGRVIPGFNEGAAGMQVGETRIVLIPPALGYGKAGSPPSIPKNATLIFVITLEGIA